MSFLFIIFLWIVIQTFKPVRNVEPEDVMLISGIVERIYEAPGDDIAIKIQGDDHYYYINRGLQHQLKLDVLQPLLLNKKVTLYSIKRWTIFTRDCNMGHISKLIIDEQVIFNEINNDTHEKTI